MATAEAAPGSLGPRLAPDDPTLPKPWKGLVDGSTGLLYYWNPETNVTQYERPASSAPPLPPGPPPSTSMPKLASIPMASNLPPNGTVSQQPTQQIVQQAGLLTQQQQQPSQHLFQQQGQITQQQQQSSQPLQLRQPGQQVLLQNTQQMSIQQPHQLPNQQMAQHQTSQQYLQIQPQHAPYQHASYLQGQPLLPTQVQQQQQGFQFSHQQGQQSQGPERTYQQGQQPQGLQIPNQQQLKESLIMHQQGQQPHGSQQGLQTLPQQAKHGLQVGQHQGRQLEGLQAGNLQVQQSQGQQSRFPWVDDALHQEGKQGALSSPSISSYSHRPPSLVPQVSIPPGGGCTAQSLHPTSGFSLQNVSPIQLQQVGTETSYGKQQHGGSAIPKQLGHAVVHPPMGGNLAYDEDEHEIAGNEFYPPSRVERPMMYPHQPKLAALPLPQNQPDAGLPPGLSGGMSIGPQHALQNVYDRAQPNPTLLRPSPGMFGPSDFSNISAADAYRQHHEVNAMGNDVPPPFMTFETTGFPPEILREMHLAGFSSPTPVQAQTWPVALQNRDVVAIAKTGSGKTLGYLIPAFIHLRRCRNNPQFGPTVLVLAPTRELASQIQDEAFKFGRSSRISCACLYGGAPKGPQLKEIERGADIVIATPGRLNDFLEMKKISFHQVSFLVLDEADRMLDMGFEPQIRKIVNEIPPRRQTLMYTATWPKEVRKIAGDLLKNPVQVNIGSVDELVANKAITQHVEVVTPMDKQRRLEQILRTQERGSKIIIFCSTKRQCDQLARSIGRTFGAASIHGDKSQSERDHVLYQFRTGRAPVLVATDVAARGLDIKDIRVVINYDFPTGIEDYVHRIGRTGRAGATGVSYTFFTDQDWKYAADLVKVLEGANQHVPPEIREMAGHGGPLLSRPRDGINRWDSGGGGRWNSGGGRGMRDGPGGFGGRGGRHDFYGGRGPRGRGFGGPGGRGRHDRAPHDRYINSDGQNRYDGRRGFGERSREKSFGRSPEMVRTWGYGRSRSVSRSRSSSSKSRSRSRSSRSRSRSGSPRSRSPSRSHDRVRRPSGWDYPPATSGLELPTAAAADAPRISGLESPPVAGHEAPPTVGCGPLLPGGSEPSLPLPGDMSPMSPGTDEGSLSRNELLEQLPVPDGGRLGDSEHLTATSPDHQQTGGLE